MSAYPQYETAQSTNVGSITAAGAQRENTALETHIQELTKLNASLYSAFERGSRCADRILGPQPQGVGSADATKDPAEPPLMRRLEVETARLHSLAEGLHRQLDRFERL